MSNMHTNFQTENRYWLTGTNKQEFHLYFELQGPEAPATVKRAPLNICLVIDRSGSMAGEKIAYAKKAAHFVVDNLQPGDVLSVVQYDDIVEVVSPAAAVQNKDEIKRRIEQLQARASTNLSGGMLQGYRQVASAQKAGYVNRVLLLSDGLANQGITQPEELQKIAQQKFRDEGIGLSTFGVGADYNELLMTNLSEYGGGHYYFIDSPDKIPTIFAEELEGLLTVVAQNARLQVDLPQEHFACEKVYGFPAEIRPGQVQINFNDVFSQEKKAVLLRLRLQKAPGEELNFRSRLTYDHVLQDYQHVVDDLLQPLQATTDPEKVRTHSSPVVAEQTVLFTANDLYEQAIDLSSSRDYEAAKKLVAHIKQYIEQYLQTAPESDELQRLYREVLDYERKIPDLESMQEQERMMFYKVSRSHKYEIMKKKGLW